MIVEVTSDAVKWLFIGEDIEQLVDPAIALNQVNSSRGG